MSGRSVILKAPRGAVELVEQGGEITLEVSHCLFVGRLVNRERIPAGGEVDLSHLDQGLGHAAAVPASGHEQVEEGREQIVIGFHPAFFEWLRSVRALGRTSQAGKEAA